MPPTPANHRHSRTNSWTSSGSVKELTSSKNTPASRPSGRPRPASRKEGSAGASNRASGRASGSKKAKKAQSPLYKTEMCRTFEENGSCPYAGRCQFAHGQDDLRPVVRHPRYKSEVCKTYHTTGVCSYGTRCRFIHGPVEGSSPVSPRAAAAGPEPVSPTGSPSTTTTRTPAAKLTSTASPVVAAFVPEPAFLVPAAVIPAVASPSSPALSSPRRLPFFRALADDENNPLWTPVASTEAEASSPLKPSHARAASISSSTSFMSLDSGSSLMALEPCL